MPDQMVTSKQCRELRDKIYDSIFPRWALITVGGILMTVLMVVYVSSTESSKIANEAMNKANIGEVRIDNLTEGYNRIEDRLTKQYEILMVIQREMPKKEH